MDDPLVVYLHDHLAGSNFAVELLENLWQRNAGSETGDVASEILAQVREDRDVLKRIIDKIGTSHFDMKDAMAWIGEKVSRMKLTDGQPHSLGTFEAIETLALGIMGKRSLWDALSCAAGSDPEARRLGFPRSLASSRGPIQSRREASLSNRIGGPRSQTATITLLRRWLWHRNSMGV